MTRNGFNADELDTSVLGALREFYTEHAEMMARAVELARTQHTNSHGERTAELGMIDSEIGKTNAKVDRYLTAFENGTMRAAGEEPHHQTKPTHRATG